MRRRRVACIWGPAAADCTDWVKFDGSWWGFVEVYDTYALTDGPMILSSDCAALCWSVARPEAAPFAQ